ncbi:hypothetical protein PACTADRAFT_50588 [Pachysolen tannophilus NRRL Y-2460]|uniref:intramembrane prenyl-peptidase Rce1 n=1 Tax=Pachysolen tannophilus NRRL Y-2460 TaxID=669874 RepID=A0A1E4TSI5_PACTA|nr:hypothetical protein PACTADRAFT_50588 [Pachysolen tannophilus NRRL Y-2460]
MTLITFILLPFILKDLSFTHSVIESLVLMGVLPGFKFDAISHTYSYKAEYLLIALKDMGNSLLLVILLFNGPLINCLVVERQNLVMDLIEELKTLQGFRNYIVAPITEELIYTSSILSCFIPLNSISFTKLIVFTPILFGFAHLHHGYQLLKEGYPVTRVVINCLVQAIYTWLFGMFTKFLFLRNGGNIYSCIVVHFFCNFMGLPIFLPNDDPKFFGRWWKYCYWNLLLLGIWAFKKNLWSLTDSQLSYIEWI